jgi:hypothetical protein
MHPRRRGLAAVLTAVLVVVSGLAAIPAAAASTDGTDADTTSCVLEATAAADTAEQDPAPATGGSLTCYANLADAMRHATGGALDLPPDATTVEQSQLDEATAATDTGATAGTAGDVAAASGRTVLGIEYRDSRFRGPTLVLTWAGSVNCYGSRNFAYPSMGAYGWNDRISSAKAYNGCWSTHYEHAGYGGDSITCSSYCTSMGAMNDKSSSIVFW